MGIKSRIYTIVVDEKRMRVVDPAPLSRKDFAQSVVDQFGRDRVQKITLIGETKG